MRVRGLVLGLTTALVVLPAAGAGSTPTPSPTVSPTASPTPSPSPSPTYSHGPVDWLPGVQYYRGDTVLHDGFPFSCLRTHRSEVDGSPTDAPALWLRQGQVHPGRQAR